MSSWKENWKKLYDAFVQSGDCELVLEKVSSGASRQIYINGIKGSLGALFIHSIAHELKIPVICVMRTRDSAIQMMRNLEFHALWHRKNEEEKLGIYQFQEEDLLSHDFQTLKDSELIIARYQVLEKLLYEKNPVIVATNQALRVPVISSERFKTALLELKPGSEWDMNDLVRRLREIGYQVVRTTRYAGEVAIRGGILDVFPVGHDFPVRLDFFGNAIESIRQFDPSTQRTREKIESIRISPCFEARSYDCERIDEAGVIPEHYEDIGGDTPGPWDELGSAYFSQVDKNSVLDYLPENGIIVLDGCDVMASLVDEETVSSMGGKWVESDLEGVELDDGADQPEIELPFLNVNLVKEKLTRHRQLVFALPGDDIKKAGVIELRTAGFSLDFGALPARIKHIIKQLPLDGGYLVTRSAKKIEEDYTDEINGRCMIYGEIFGGFLLLDAGIAVAGDEELFPKKIHPLERHKRKSITQKELRMIHSGEYIVHTDYGVGIFKGIERRTVNSVTRDYILLEYAYGDKLFVPTDQLDSIFKYSGGEGSAPSVNRLGTSDWQKTKQRIKKSLRKIAEDLLLLYRKRATLKGFSFSPDQPWQSEIEDEFEYIETEGQERSIREVKRDMESDKPMDRLVCGEVGYGKTELAVRAALKAVLDGKQVALLCPTTVLAQQHFLTFSRRLGKLPLRVEMLSRFRSKKEQSDVVKNLAKGSVEIVIGTHRLISSDVVFAKLGLLIVDEEQKFGVRHKEKIKMMKSNIDVLTLTATPIPRTLYMSLVGLRDISFIDTPPPGRLPIKTVIKKYDERLVKEAIIREMERGGQVYYLFNRVETIMSVYEKLMRMVPNAKIAVGHGQMDERKLEKVMLEFLSGEFDALLCTTIIENGLDIPNVNTLIVENAQNFGLAQLHQLRGRVGRSNRQAYSYFLYPDGARLTSIGRQRLEALATFSHLGAGYEIARRDLELRGAGNILGQEQHGFVSQVGLEMYCRLVDETIYEIKREEGLDDDMEEIPISGPAVDVPFSAHLPEKYIPAIAERLDIYRRLGRIKSDSELTKIEVELRDRFGELPDVAERLLEIVKMKNALREIYVNAAHYNLEEKKFFIVFEAGQPPLPWKQGNCFVGHHKLNKTQNGFWFRATGEWSNIHETVIEIVEGIKTRQFMSFANKH
jgi:transcription-repair coupling factor (superfamily II helicase)